MVAPSSQADEFDRERSVSKLRIESHMEREHELEAEKRNVAPPIFRTTVEGINLIGF